MPSLVSATTFLFVPGARSDRYDKAVATGADVVILDLEDAVAPDGKDDARRDVARWLDGGGTAAVRINGSSTPWYDDDVAMVAPRGCPVVLPKAESGAQLTALTGRLPDDVEVVPLVETARGIRRIDEMCAVPQVTRPAFGSVDYAVDLGVDHLDDDALWLARAELVLSARAAGVAAPIDGVTTAVRDPERLVRDCATALSLGLTGKLCIHPSQIAPVAEAFRPTGEQLAWARRVIDAAGAGAVAVLDGALVDKPVVDRAAGLLARAGEHVPGR
ncbi:HpcH/HpaI aldolase/citrate lyase family protein [Pseudonocardia phyllosphaerae]|uniref:HpcH/HpaI aldolase/citrate lyase family protein n=1 Tax=Pseudonocardia phyllosphaerae TaxID=3390502 RepID=UPI003979E4B3